MVSYVTLSSGRSLFKNRKNYDSREFKLMLNVDRFTDRERGSSFFLGP